MLRESGSGQDVSEVSSAVLRKERIPLTARNTSSLVIDSLCDQAKRADIAIACLYYDFLVQQEQTITNMMGAILKQLIGGGDIPKNVQEAFQEGKKEIGGRGLRVAGLMRMLGIAIASLPPVFICIDALDECVPKNLPELLESLRDIVRESPSTRIFLTARSHVKEVIQTYFAKVVVLPISPNTEDIRNYLEMRLDRDVEPDAMDNDLRADIVSSILDKMSDMYVAPFRASPLSNIYAYRLCVDSFLFR